MLTKHMVTTMKKDPVIRSFKKECKGPGLLGLEKRRLPRPRINSFQHYVRNCRESRFDIYSSTQLPKLVEVTGKQISPETKKN